MHQRPGFSGVTYRMHGPGDYFYRARLDPDGRFRVERGSFRSAPPRIGRIDFDTRVHVELLLARIAPLASWSYGPPVQAFESELIVEDGAVPRAFRWSANSLGVPHALHRLAGVLRDL